MKPSTKRSIINMILFVISMLTMAAFVILDYQIRTEEKKEPYECVYCVTKLNPAKIAQHWVS